MKNHPSYWFQNEVWFNLLLHYEELDCYIALTAMNRKSRNKLNFDFFFQPDFMTEKARLLLFAKQYTMAKRTNIRRNEWSDFNLSVAAFLS